MRAFLNRYLDTVGDGSGTKNANTNAATDFLIKPGSTQSFIIERLTVIVEDVGALAAAGYGALSALASGIDLIHAQPAEVSLLGGLLITRHYDWLRLPHKAPHVDTTALGGVSNNVFIAELVFPEPLVLNGKYGNDRLIVRVPAVDLTGLEGHYFRVNGTIAGII